MGQSKGSRGLIPILIPIRRICTKTGSFIAVCTWIDTARIVGIEIGNRNNGFASMPIALFSINATANRYNSGFVQTLILRKKPAESPIPA
jgi:hypothetical protein